MIYFLDSTNGVYQDKDFNKMAGLLFSDGVFNTKADSHAAWLESGDFLVEAPGADMNITARAGSATLKALSGGESQQIILQEDAQLSATVADNVTLAVRMDAVVLRLNQATITGDNLNAAKDNAVSLVVVSGSSANPLTDAELSVALSVAGTPDPYVRLADVVVPLGATEIVPSNLTDTRQLVKMTRTVKAGFDVVQLYSLQNDPKASQLNGGEIWYNQFDGILKFFNGTEITALQTQTFDWGYYPPDGVDDRSSEFDTVYENEGEEGVSSAAIWKYDNFAGDDGTTMAGQLFIMPNLQNPFFQVKMGNPTYQSDLVFEVWTVDASGNPVTEVQTPSVRSMSQTIIPKNDYVDLFLDGSLYTPGQTYLMVIKAEGISRLNTSDDSDFKTGRVQTSSLNDDAFFQGTKQGNDNNNTQVSTANSSAMTWFTTVANRQWVMRVSDRAEFEISGEDTAGSAHEVSQPFIAKSRDLVSFRLVKANSDGTPTGDITATMYAADDDGNTVGNALTSATVLEADWNAVAVNDNVVFPLEYDQMTVGAKYVVVIDTDVKDNDNSYAIQFANYSLGQARRFNSIDGWVDLGGDFFYSVETSSSSKILVLGPDGLIPQKLINLETFEKIPVEKVTGSFTRSGNAATAQVLYPHTLGRQPNRIKFTMFFTSGDYRGMSEAVWLYNDGSPTIQCLWSYFWTNGNASSGLSTSFFTRAYTGTATNEYQQGVVTAVDETDITIDWALVGTPQGATMQIMYEME